MSRKGRVIVLLPLILLSIWGCNKDNDDDDNSPGFDQSELLRNWGDNIIEPNYEKYALEIAALNNAVQGLADNPSSTEVDAIKTAFSQAYLKWQTVSVFEFGPAADEVLRSNSNVYPCDTAGVNTKVNNKDLELGAASDLDKKGFPAVDYLLNGPIALDGADRVNYLKAVVFELNKKAETVHKSWDASGANYVNSFATNTGNDVGSSLGMMINAINQHLEAFHREGKIGIPNGERSFSGTPLPGNVEGFYQRDQSLAMARKNLETIQSIYLGTDANGNDGKGLDDYLNAVGAKYNGSSLDAAIKAQFDACFTAYDQVSMPLADAVVNENEKVGAVYKEIQKLVVLTKTDVPSSLGVLITYQDNDGD